VVLLTDAVPTLRVQPQDLAEISLLPPHKNITLLVDESHSLGILGTQGGGIYSGIQLPNVHRKILVASLGKALGLTGGLIGGDENFLAEVMQNPCYVGGAGMNPAFAQTLADGAALIRGQQEKLRESLAFLFNLIGHSDKVLFHPDYPILYPVHDGLYDWLYKNRILITHFPYPTSPKGLSRIILSAHHEKKDLERLAAVIEDFRP
jgi:7-keto-8-aminopelargonate synthetase-like enzyme